MFVEYFMKYLGHDDIGHNNLGGVQLVKYSGFEFSLKALCLFVYLFVYVKIGYVCLASFKIRF